MTSYTVADAKNTLPKLIDRALEGEEVVITRRGKPVVELRPTTSQIGLDGGGRGLLHQNRQQHAGIQIDAQFASGS